MSFIDLSITWDRQYTPKFRAGKADKLGGKSFGGRYYFLQLGRLHFGLEGIR